MEMISFTQEMSTLFLRDLKRLSAEVDAYQDPADMWQKAGDIGNSAGHLTLHICGNLQHFIGAQIGASGYVRNRQEEFESAPVSVNDLHQLIAQTADIVEQSLSSLPEQKLNQPFPIEVFGHPMSHQHFLIHLYGHLNYHLGQINYHRRMKV